MKTLRASLLLFALFALSCSDSTTPTLSGTVIEVTDNVFTPADVNISQGDTVTWHWSGSIAHHVVSDNDAFTPSETQQAGSHTITFLTAGTFGYHCTIHGTTTTGMRGTITVKSAGLQ